jgi:hypothetical protein
MNPKKLYPANTKQPLHYATVKNIFVSVTLGLQADVS